MNHTKDNIFLALRAFFRPTSTSEVKPDKKTFTRNIIILLVIDNICSSTTIPHCLFYNLH